jgi:hypothetical protein
MRFVVYMSKAAEETDDPKKHIDERLKQFKRIYKRGILSLPDVVEEGFDSVIDLLECFGVLFELDTPGPEIKYQCSCSDFWYYYKCPHSLALSITRNGIEVPAIYKLKNTGTKRKAGRPKNAKGGEALSNGGGGGGVGS